MLCPAPSHREALMHAIQNFFNVFPHGWIEHIQLPRKECLLNFQKQIFQENFQENLDFHISLQKVLSVHTYVNVLLFSVCAAS